MKITHLQADILSVETNIICQSVNFQGVMGSGLALQIKKRYPEIISDNASYRNICKIQTFESVKRNGIVAWFTMLPDANYIACIFGQEFYRKIATDKTQYTDYVALGNGLESVKTMASTKNFTKIAIPFNMGCDRGGGDWKVVYDIIKRCFQKTQFEILICAYP
jgi:O-acetyl-ADP-ribose deacetylase (regulator of RNase III)